jgi:hypothetical protein
MVRRFRSGVGAVLLVLTLMAMVSGTVLASGHIASDGQTLADQSQEVQDLYASVYGDDAATQWAIEHDRELGFDRAAADDMAMGDITLTQEYQDVYAAALERSGDAELSHRIALDVLGRGSVAAFLEGSDPGVLYGIWVMAPPAPVVITRTVTVTVPAASPAPAAPAAQVGTGLFAGISQDNLDLVVWVAMDEAGETLPLANQLEDIGGATYDYVYEVAGLPAGLSFSAESRVISGTPRATGSSLITYTVTETKSVTVDAEAVETMREGELTFTISVMEAAANRTPTFGSADVASRTLFVGEPLLISLPSASGGDGELSYALSPEAGVGELTYDAVNRELYSAGAGVTLGDEEFTWTVSDADEPPDTDVITFTITTEVNSLPVVNDQTLEPAVVGTSYLAVVVGSDVGNAPLSYSLTGLPAGLDFNASSRQIVGTPSEAGDFTMTLTVTDNDGQSDSADVTLIVTEPETEGG